MDELIDILTSEGEASGTIALKSEAHQKGWFHATVHIWLFTADAKVLLQKRGRSKKVFPGLWDISVAGHVAAGESILEGALREVQEEIGLQLYTDDLRLIDVRKNINQFSNGITDCEFQHVFLAEYKTDIKALKIQTEEVDAVRLFTFDELETCLRKQHPIFSIVPADMNYYRYVMDEVLKQISA